MVKVSSCLHVNLFYSNNIIIKVVRDIVDEKLEFVEKEIGYVKKNENHLI